MRICPTCGFENPHGALICAKCYTLLVEVKGTQVDSTLPHTMPLAKTRILGNPSRIDINALDPDVIAMYFDEYEKPLIVHVGQQAILGRHTADATVQPRIDLTPYGALVKGISRVHVMLRRTTEGFTIEDLASSNGSWLNGTRLQTYTRMPLRSGDHWLLGELSFEIYYRNAACG